MITISLNSRSYSIAVNTVEWIQRHRRNGLSLAQIARALKVEPDLLRRIMSAVQVRQLLGGGA